MEAVGALSEGVILRVPGNLSEYCLLLITSNLWKRSKTKILFSPDDGFSIETIFDPCIFTPLLCFKWNGFWWITPSETLVSGSKIMAQVRDIKISDTLKFPGIFTALICFKWNDIWLITPSETLVSGATIMAHVRDIKVSDALTFPGISTPLICFKWNDIWLITPPRNVSVRFEDYDPSKGH